METTLARKTLLRPAVAFAAATVVTAAFASVAQTQINLAALSAIGHPANASVRLAVTLEDLARFGPVMAAIAGGALLPAFLAAGFAERLVPRLRSAVYAAAGVAGLWAAFWIMGFFTPMPTLVAATRGAAGLATICATGALGGLAFAALTRRGRPLSRRLS